MASGKLPPRQKMIGLMYLVLLALLAMNVSKSILESFVIINDGIEITAKTWVHGAVRPLLLAMVGRCLSFGGQKTCSAFDTDKTAMASQATDDCHWGCGNKHDPCQAKK